MAVINFANKNELTERPIRTGTYFEKPSVAELQIDKAAQDHGGILMLEAPQIREVLAKARPVLKAMILLQTHHCLCWPNLLGSDCYIKFGKVEF